MKPSWSEITAIFGGSFDPPHLGHREAVRGLFQTPGVKEVVILPSAQVSRHKSCVARPEHRHAMVQINFKPTLDDPLYPTDVRFETQELHATNPQFTFDTLLKLKKATPALAFVVGSDQLLHLASWHRFPELLNLSHWIVLKRKGSPEEEVKGVLSQWQSSGLIQNIPPSPLWKIKGGNTCLFLQDTEAPSLSSTEIREAIGRNGSPPPGSLLPEIRDYLKIHLLYGIRKNS